MKTQRVGTGHHWHRGWRHTGRLADMTFLEWGSKRVSCSQGLPYELMANLDIVEAPSRGVS